MSECEAREWIGYIVGAVAVVVCVVGPVVAGAGLWAMAKLSQIPLPEAGEDGCGNGEADDECGAERVDAVAEPCDERARAGRPWYGHGPETRATRRTTYDP